MYFKYLFLLLFLALNFNLYAQNFWKKIQDTDQSNQSKNRINQNYTLITKKHTYQLELKELMSYMVNAPDRNTSSSSSLSLSFPVDSTYEEFKIYKTSTLSEKLSQKFPTIKSFIGFSKEKNHSIRITITNQGLFGMILKDNSTIYINPYHSDKNMYEVFSSNNTIQQNKLICLTESLATKKNNTNVSHKKIIDDGMLRKYRLAVATTGEYSQFHIIDAGVSNGTTQQKINAVLSAIVVTIDRVNQIYERDLSITLELVNNNENIIYLDGSTDPFSNYNESNLIDESQTEIDNTIGTTNYDIGHTFSTGAGGLAELFAVCSDGFKARGVTGTSSPIGDPYDVDYVAHEIGHQFGANHTFNGDAGSCGGFNRNPPTAVEPGSGSTIMAYAGICSSQDVQNNSDPYFHIISINEIYNFISSTGGSCYSSTMINNSPPAVLPVPNYTIPYGTAFILDCEATDLNNDNLTYTWEQVDEGITTIPPSPTATNGALFRSIEPSTSSERFFPNQDSVLNNNLTPTWEVIPSVAREMNFTVTVRDNNILGGQNTTANTIITTANVGPFEITSQNNTGLNYNPNDVVNVNWNVAGTTANNINTQFVNILLSYDGGLNFTEVLAANTPNDGSQTVIIPGGIFSNECRIKIEAVDNIFYAINKEGFTIHQLNIPEQAFTDSFIIYPNPNKGTFNLEIAKNFTHKNVQLTIFDISGRKIYKKQLNNAENIIPINLNQVSQGIYLVEISSNNLKLLKKIIIN